MSAADKHYGLVLALQVFVSELSMDLKQSVESDELAECPEMVGRLFRIGLRDLHTTVAVDDDVHDLRYAFSKHTNQPTLIIGDLVYSGSEDVGYYVPDTKMHGKFNSEARNTRMIQRFLIVLNNYFGSWKR